MIKITGGVFGMRDKKGSITYKTERDEPFSLSTEEEKRLVGRGVAEYVSCSSKAEPEKAEPEHEKIPSEDPVLSEKMKLDELKDIALDYGLDCSSMRSKVEVIEAIKEAQDNPDEEEDVPEISAAEPQV